MVELQWKTIWQFLKKIEYGIIILPCNYTFRYIPRRIKDSYSSKYVCLPAHSMDMSPKREQPKDPSADKWINKFWIFFRKLPHTTECYSNRKGWGTDTCCSMDKPQNLQSERNQLLFFLSLLSIFAPYILRLYCQEHIHLRLLSPPEELLFCHNVMSFLGQCFLFVFIHSVNLCLLICLCHMHLMHLLTSLDLDVLLFVFCLFPLFTLSCFLFGYLTYFSILFYLFLATSLHNFYCFL